MNFRDIKDVKDLLTKVALLLDQNMETRAYEIIQAVQNNQDPVSSIHQAFLNLAKDSIDLDLAQGVLDFQVLLERTVSMKPIQGISQIINKEALGQPNLNSVIPAIQNINWFEIVEEAVQTSYPEYLQEIDWNAVQQAVR